MRGTGQGQGSRSIPSLLRTPSMFILFLVLATLTLDLPVADGGSNKVKLKNVETLTLYEGRLTTGRRSAPVPQLSCVGGTAKCKYVPPVVQCYNRGWDGVDVQWECKAEMENLYKFGKLSVLCEGYDYPDDEYILAGSCGLEYSIDLTDEGYAKAKTSKTTWDDSTSYFTKPNNQYTKPGKQSESSMGGIVFTVVVLILLYAFYKTCIAPEDPSMARSRTNSDYPGGGGDDRPTGTPRPPPPGFRSDYYPGTGSTFDSDSCHSTQRPSGGSGSGAGGFWTGAATGGLLGYMFGNRNTGGAGVFPGTSRDSYGYGQGTSGSSWGGWGGGGGGSHSSSSSSGGSSGSRSASGYGGTTRR